MSDKKAKALMDVVTGKKPGWGAANPNFPNDNHVNPTYSPNSGNGPIGDPGFSNPNYPKITKKKNTKK